MTHQTQAVDCHDRQTVTVARLAIASDDYRPSDRTVGFVELTIATVRLSVRPWHSLTTKAPRQMRSS